MESHLHAVLGPVELEGFIEATLDIFWEVAPTSRLLLVDILLHLLNVAGEVRNVEAEISVLDISVGDEGDFDGQAGVLVPHVVDNLAQRVLGALDPAVHRPGAV